MHRKYTLLGGLQKSYLLLQFHSYNKIYDFISFTNTRSRASHSQFFEFLKNKNLRTKSKIFSSKNRICCIFFFVLHVFYWKEIENAKTTNATILGIQFPTKWCLFQPPRSKTVGGDTFLVAKSVLFRGVGGENHIKT